MAAKKEDSTINPKLIPKELYMAINKDLFKVQSLYKKGKHTEVLTVINKLIKEHGEYHLFLSLRALGYISLKRHDMAYDEVKAIIKSEIIMETVFGNVSLVLNALQKYEALMIIYENRLRKCPSSEKLFKRLVTFSVCGGNFDVGQKASFRRFTVNKCEKSLLCSVVFFVAAEKLNNLEKFKNPLILFKLLKKIMETKYESLIRLNKVEVSALYLKLIKTAVKNGLWSPSADESNDLIKSKFVTSLEQILELKNDKEIQNYKIFITLTKFYKHINRSDLCLKTYGKIIQKWPEQYESKELYFKTFFILMKNSGEGETTNEIEVMELTKKLVKSLTHKPTQNLLIYFMDKLEKLRKNKKVKNEKTKLQNKHKSPLTLKYSDYMTLFSFIKHLFDFIIQMQLKPVNGETKILNKAENAAKSQNFERTADYKNLFLILFKEFFTDFGEKRCFFADIKRHLVQFEKFCGMKFDLERIKENRVKKDLKKTGKENENLLKIKLVKESENVINFKNDSDKTGGKDFAKHKPLDIMSLNLVRIKQILRVDGNSTSEVLLRKNCEDLYQKYQSTSGFESEHFIFHLVLNLIDVSLKTNNTTPFFEAIYLLRKHFEKDKTSRLLSCLCSDLMMSYKACVTETCFSDLLKFVLLDTLSYRVSNGFEKIHEVDELTKLNKSIESFQYQSLEASSKYFLAFVSEIELMQAVDVVVFSEKLRLSLTVISSRLSNFKLNCLRKLSTETGSIKSVLNPILQTEYSGEKGNSCLFGIWKEEIQDNTDRNYMNGEISSAILKEFFGTKISMLNGTIDLKTQFNLSILSTEICALFALDKPGHFISETFEKFEKVYKKIKFPKENGLFKVDFLHWKLVHLLLKVINNLKSEFGVGKNNGCEKKKESFMLEEFKKIKRALESVLEEGVKLNVDFGKYVFFVVTISKHFMFYFVLVIEKLLSEFSLKSEERNPLKGVTKAIKSFFETASGELTSKNYCERGLPEEGKHQLMVLGNLKKDETKGFFEFIRHSRCSVFEKRKEVTSRVTKQLLLPLKNVLETLLKEEN